MYIVITVVSGIQYGRYGQEKYNGCSVISLKFKSFISLPVILLTRMAKRPNIFFFNQNCNSGDNKIPNNYYIYCPFRYISFHRL